MKLWKYTILSAVLMALVGLNFSATAGSISDPTNDVLHWALTGGTWNWTDNVQNKSYLDITQVSSEINEKNLTLGITVSGPLRSSPNVFYTAWYNTTTTSYQIYWTNSKGEGLARPHNSTQSYDIRNLVVSPDNHTISGKFRLIDNTTPVEVWGWTAEFTNPGLNRTRYEWWGDWAPNTKAPYIVPPSNNTNGSTKTKTPGFEALGVIGALVSVTVYALVLRRRR